MKKVVETISKTVTTVTINRKDIVEKFDLVHNSRIIIRVGSQDIVFGESNAIIEYTHEQEHESD